MIRSVAVFCGSKPGNNEKVIDHAEELGSLLGGKGIRLIYGGGNVGLMSVVANAVLQTGGEVIGVIPDILAKRERSHTGISELLVVEDMHTRKKKMYELCDAAVILPGGYGTLDELFEMITWNNLSIHNKKIFILNTDGFYDQLLKHIDVMLKHGFLYEDPYQMIKVVDVPKQILPYIN